MDFRHQVLGIMSQLLNLPGLSYFSSVLQAKSIGHFGQKTNLVAQFIKEYSGLPFIVYNAFLANSIGHFGLVIYFVGRLNFRDAHRIKKL